MIPISISVRAREEIKHTLSNKNIPDRYGLRIGVKGGGCAGVSYILGFDTQKEDDAVYNIDHIPVYIAKKNVMFLLGMEIDFYEGNEARGFVFVNPGEQKSLNAENS
jgi:iron-sulfur cluster assembly protein